MKKIISLFISTICFALISYSCNKKTDDLKYSCNPSINQWALENKARLTTYNRQELSAILSVDSQLAIYRAMDSTQQCNIWKEKLQWVVDSANLTMEEKNHILIAKNHLHPHFFNGIDTSLRVWSDNWITTGLNQFGWDSVRVFLIVETFMLPSELNVLKQHIIATNGGNPQYAPIPDPNLPGCNCLSAIGCQWFVESCDKSGGCNITNTGCGPFATWGCSGGCSGGLLSSGTVDYDYI